MTAVFLPPEDVADDSHGETGGTTGEFAVVDVRPEREYAEGHVPGAVNVPFGEFRDPAAETPGTLPTSERLAALLGEAGVSSDDRLVAYDGEFGVYASRLLVTAEVFGHDPGRLYLLDGDYGAWRRDHPVATGTPEVEPQRYECERGDGPLIDAGELDAALEGEAVVVDTRDPLEYDTVHLPGAINLQWRTLVDEDERRLKPLDRCREILRQRGIAFDRPVRLYCNTARRLGFVYAVLRELSHEDVAFYEGGIDAWADWGGEVETSV